MCGIVGVAGEIAPYRGIFPAALASIVHRGPDGEGTMELPKVLFGHRRLAIIDLTEGGHQPMTDAATGTVITFNGEIFNYRELRTELEQQGVRFRSSSDTEVLLRAFLHWRTEMFSRLNGMWAFAIWEPATATLTLSRDRFGVKPLYWHHDGSALLFGSEAKALIALKPSLAEPNSDAIYDLVVNSRSHASQDSFYKHIISLPPATTATYRPGDTDLRMMRYWNYPAPDDAAYSGDSGEEFGALIDDSVRLRLRSDVPIGLTLSGGLDSSAILAAAQKQSAAPVRCFTSVYGESERGEERWARIATEACGADLEAVVAGHQDWLATLGDIVHHMDGPGYSSAVFPLWAIMKRARASGVPVLLEGQGADELLGGYPHYTAIQLAAAVRTTLSGKTSIADLRRAFTAAKATFGARGLAAWMLRQNVGGALKRFDPKNARHRMMRDVEGSLQESARATPPPGYTPLQKALHSDHSDTVLPSLLHYGDAISMAHGIEARLPFMDYRLVEWAFRKHPPLIVDGKTKAPIRSYLAANGMQAIAERRDKLGYPTAIARWINTGEGRVMIDDWLASSNVPLWSFIERSAVARLVAKARTGDSTAIFHTYKLVVTNIWLMQIGTARAPSPPIGNARGHRSPGLTAAVAI